jgi:Protein of unknown function (DUF2690)
MLLTTALMVLATMILMPAGSAQAATCSGFGCDGRDPIATGCASGTVTNTGTTYIYNSAGQALAYLELRYGVGCATNWGRITRVGSARSIYVSVYRPSPYASTSSYGGTGSSYYGDQLYGSSMTVCAVGQAVDNATLQFYSAEVCG